MPLCFVSAHTLHILLFLDVQGLETSHDIPRHGLSVTNNQADGGEVPQFLGWAPGIGPQLRGVDAYTKADSAGPYQMHVNSYEHGACR